MSHNYEPDDSTTPVHPFFGAFTHHSIKYDVLYFSETRLLSQEQMRNTREAMMEMKQAELKSYLQIADTALAPLKARQAPLDDAIAILREIQFGQSGYIFGYDSKVLACY